MSLLSVSLQPVVCWVFWGEDFRISQFRTEDFSNVKYIKTKSLMVLRSPSLIYLQIIWALLCFISMEGSPGCRSWATIAVVVKLVWVSSTAAPGLQMTED